MSENGTDYDEEVDIDEEEETETFHVPKVSPQKDSGDVIYDFKKVRQILTNTCGHIKVYSTPLLGGGTGGILNAVSVHLRVIMMR